MSGAGLFAGEITQGAPVADSATTKPRSYVWFEYGTPISEVVATSGEGYAVTQENWFGSNPDFANPFANQVWDAITMSAVFKPKLVPINSAGPSLFNITSVGQTEFFTRRRPISNELYFGFTITSNGGALIAQDTIELTLDHPGWDVNHWFWMGVSYSNTLNEGYLTVTNLTLSEEQTIPIAITTNQQLTWGPSLTSQSIVAWGLQGTDGSGTFGSEFRGPQSQVLIHDGYKDFSDEFTRRQFVGINGIIDIGPTGNYPFGVTPRIFMPRGWPEGNLGTLFVGNSADFWLQNQVATDLELPPIAT